MKELELQVRDPLPIEAKQHLQKKVTSLRIPIGAKLFGYNLVTGECEEVRKESSVTSTEQVVHRNMIMMDNVTVNHHKITFSKEVCYIVAINKANAVRKGLKIRKRLTGR